MDNDIETWQAIMCVCFVLLVIIPFIPAIDDNEEDE